MHWKEYTHVLYRTSKLPNPRSRRDVMPSEQRREHAQYVTSLKIYFRPRLTAVASWILKSLLNWGAGGIRELTLDANEIEQMLQCRKASFLEKCLNYCTFVANCLEAIFANCIDFFYISKL